MTIIEWLQTNWVITLFGLAAVIFFAYQSFQMWRQKQAKKKEVKPKEDLPSTPLPPRVVQELENISKQKITDSKEYLQMKLKDIDQEIEKNKKVRQIAKEQYNRAIKIDEEYNEHIPILQEHKEILVRQIKRLK